MAIDKADECLLVEGYTDVIALHQAGIENVVASGGTSLTADQLRLIKKYTNNLTIVYDGDAAGVKAALRGLDMALEEGLNVKLVLIPDGDDPDSYVNKAGAAAFKEFVQKNKKDFILFQLQVALKDAGNDSVKKSEVVNTIAETISRINKAEDFTKQQDYIKQCAELLKIDEAGLHALVNKFIRNRISTQEKRLPFEEAKQFEENAKQAAETDYDDRTFSLLFKDELQEKEIARILLEHGLKPYDGAKLIAEHVFEEMVDESLFDNAEVLILLNTFKMLLQSNPSAAGKSFFIYHEDMRLSTLAVSLLNVPYEESEHWKREFSQATGYQKGLFQMSYEEFSRTIKPANESELLNYLKTEEDKTHIEVDSALNYLKLRKIKRMLLENQADMDKPHTDEERLMLYSTHQHLKQMEIEITKKLGSVIIN
jgi:DNA primase